MIFLLKNIYIFSIVNLKNSEIYFSTFNCWKSVTFYPSKNVKLKFILFFEGFLAPRRGINTSESIFIYQLFTFLRQWLFLSSKHSLFSKFCRKSNFLNFLKIIFKAIPSLSFDSLIFDFFKKFFKIILLVYFWPFIFFLYHLTHSFFG